MKLILATICFVIVSVSGRPEAPPPPPPPPPGHPPGEATPVPIVSKIEEIGVDGSFNFSFETGDGIHVEEHGYLKKSPTGKSLESAAEDQEGNDIQVIEGSYSYTAPDGQNIVVKFIADENGFRPEGDHLPTPPPSPPGIAGIGTEEQKNLGQPPPQLQEAAVGITETTTIAN